MFDIVKYNDYVRIKLSISMFITQVWQKSLFGVSNDIIPNILFSLGKTSYHEQQRHIKIRSLFTLVYLYQVKKFTH
jgi:hypothetical protein